MRTLAKMTSVPIKIIKSISIINENKGMQELYKQRSSEVLHTLRTIATIQSAESSNRIEGIEVTNKQLLEIMQHQSLPRDGRGEAEISGYRDVLATIHASAAHIPIKPQTILQFHRDMYKYLPQPGGRWKATDSIIEETFPDGVKRIRFEPVKPFLVPEAMDQLCNNFNRFRENQDYDDLLLINAFILDFLCIHPFADGNGRMARLLTLLLLYQAGFEVGRFISIERIIEQSKETYYDVLFKSSQGWHQGEHDPIPWMDYSLGIILAAYKELKDRISLSENQRGTKSALIKDAIEHFVGEFTLQDIKKACPTVSRPTIYRVLEDLKSKGNVDCVVSGRHARWVKRE